MRLYAGTTLQLFDDVARHSIAGDLKTAYLAYFGYKPSEEEVGSWENSITALAGVFQDAGLEDHAVAIEYQLPLTSRRIDCMIAGQDDRRRDNAVIVELKQWESCESSECANEVVTWVGGTKREVLHPSMQVLQYREYLQDTDTAFYGDGAVQLSSCAYLHNYLPRKNDVLFDSKFLDILQQSPAFTEDRSSQLEGLLRERLVSGHGTEVMKHIDAGTYRPSKKLLEHVAGMIKGNQEYILLDEQRVVYDKVMAVARGAAERKQKTVIVVRGGPGTGKSVIALNLMADLARLGIGTEYATGSRSFTTTLRQVVGHRGGALFKYFNSYMDADDNQLDVLICDEAHRIRKNSNSIYTPKARRTDQPQIDELLHAAHVGVFFIDDDQVVRPDEIGSSDLILQRAHEQGIECHEYDLEAQFRCAGSEAFVAWVENTLRIRRTANVLWSRQEAFDFRIMDSPQEVEKAIRAKVAEGYTGRMTAGFCWPWSKQPDDHGSLIKDVELEDYGYKRPWNAPPEMARLPKGVPSSNLWAYEPSGIDQVGCVYTAQGFEFDYAGVIVGRDLVYRFATQDWQAQSEFCHDSVVRRSKDKLAELLKNTYRVLLTRGLKGCYVFFEDKETRDYFRSRIE
jgi:DUF2075 family protein